MANENARHMLTCTYKPNHRAENCPRLETEPTTARILGVYRRELEAEGFSEDEVRTLSIEAARQLLREEPLTIGTKLPDGMTLLRIVIPIEESLVTDRGAVEQAASEAALKAVQEVLS